MMNKILLNLFSVTACILLSVRCTVKEDRMSCPCALVLDFSDVDTLVINSADIYMTDGDQIVFDEVLDPDDFRDDFVVNVPRTEIDLGIWSGADFTGPQGGIDIPYGEDCPLVYFHTSQVDADAEIVREKVHMHKNHCVMTLELDWDKENPDAIVLFGNVDGYDADGTPARGEFAYDLVLDVEGNGKAVLPRQVDNSLILEVNDGSGAVKRFALGEYIYQSGYDWTEPDLKDITVKLDLAFLHVTLKIQGWDTSHRFDIII